MTTVPAGRPYLMIGDVINVLKDEFPDITVSKIRFLEGEGLVHPERTPSGYRRFSPADVERLRFVLRLQRDHFLPLKVIRERLASWDASGSQGQPTLGLEEAGPTGQPGAAEQAPAPVPEEPLESLATGLSLTESELARASGLSEADLEELRSFGLLEPKPAGEGEVRYTELDLEVAKLCRELFRLGLEPRHLRVFRSGADRVAALAEQMVLPLVKQRNPEARRTAAQTVRELVRVGSRLQHALLRGALAPYA